MLILDRKTNHVSIIKMEMSSFGFLFVCVSRLKMITFKNIVVVVVIDGLNSVKFTLN